MIYISLNLLNKMRLYILILLIVTSAISFTNAQVKEISGKPPGSLKLVKKAKINGGNFQLFIKNIKETVIETTEPQQDPNAPKVITSLKHLMDYDSDASGEEYVLYRLNNKGKKIFELTFPRLIKNGAYKIITEGSYMISGHQLLIIFKRFDYHFPSEMTIVYNVDKYGRLSFLKRHEKALNTDNFSDNYIKKVEEKTIKSN